MTDKPLITIGIPTYNGSKYILDALNSIQPQIGVGLVDPALVDVLIVDNASTDGVSQKVADWCRDHGFPVRYVINPENIGFDRNVDKVFTLARGEYVWLLADDDALVDGSVPYVIDILHGNQDLGVVLMNFDQYDRNLERIVDQVKLEFEGRCVSANDFLRKSRNRYGQVSSLLIKRDCWVAAGIDGGIGSNFAHVFGLMKIILMANSYIISRPLVRVRMGSTSTGTSGYSLLSIAMDAGSIVRSMKDMGHDPSILRSMVKEARGYTFNTIPIAKLAGLDNRLKIIKRLIAVFNSPMLWLKWIPVILIPDGLFLTLYSLKKKVSVRLKFIERGLKKLFKR